MLEKLSTVGEGSLQRGQWIQFCTSDPVDQKLETIYRENQFYFVTSVQHLRRFKEERHIYVADVLGEETHKFCTNKMEFDHNSLNNNTWIKFVSKSDVKSALGDDVDIDLVENRGSAYCVGNSESSFSSDNSMDVEMGDGMDVFCSAASNSSDPDDVGCPVS